MRYMYNKHNNSSSTTIPNNTQEIPITAHIFEGHLYLKEDNKWTWRLFRFDGSSLTCLSSKKNKLPPHTLLDPPSQSDNRPISFLTSSTTMNSLTSPLLATPKNRTVRLTSDSTSNLLSNDDPPAIASYYQLPKWTIKMINISTISILKPTNNKSRSMSFKHPFTSTTTKSKSFSIRTYDGGCYIMKAHKHHDLERWIFVLVKMWKFSQAARQLHQPAVPPRPQSLVLPYSINQYHNATPMLSGPDYGEDHMSHQLQPQYQIQQQQQQNEGRQRDIIEQQPTNNTQAPPSSLSNEKVLWIEEWIKSLAELAACGDSTSELNYISAYETTSSFATSSVITSSSSSSSSNSRRKPSLRQNQDNKRIQRPTLLKKSYKTTTKTEKKIIIDQNHHQPHTQRDDSVAAGDGDKKKVKKCLTNNNSGSEINNFNMNFFQDVNTVYTDETSANKKYTHQSLRYHTSTRGHKAKLVRNNTTPTIEDTTIPIVPPMMYNNDSIKDNYYYSPLENLKNKVSKGAFSIQQKQKQQATVSDENVCLADVQKFLQNMDIQDKQQQRYSLQQPSTSPANKIRPQSTFGSSKNWYRNSWTPDVSTFT